MRSPSSAPAPPPRTPHASSAPAVPHFATGTAPAGAIRAAPRMRPRSTRSTHRPPRSRPALTVARIVAFPPPPPNVCFRSPAQFSNCSADRLDCPRLTAYHQILLIDPPTKRAASDPAPAKPAAMTSQRAQPMESRSSQPWSGRRSCACAPAIAVAVASAAAAAPDHRKTRQRRFQRPPPTPTRRRSASSSASILRFLSAICAGSKTAGRSAARLSTAAPKSPGRAGTPNDAASSASRFHC